jgi:hypothetical protein
VLLYAIELGRLNNSVIVSVFSLSLNSLARLVQGALNKELKNVNSIIELERDLGVLVLLS